MINCRAGTYTKGVIYRWRRAEVHSWRLVLALTFHWPNGVTCHWIIQSDIRPALERLVFSWSTLNHYWTSKLAIAQIATGLICIKAEKHPVFTLFSPPSRAAASAGGRRHVYRAPDLFPVAQHLFLPRISHLFF